MPCHQWGLFGLQTSVLAKHHDQIRFWCGSGRKLLMSLSDSFAQHGTKRSYKAVMGKADFPSHLG